MFTPSIYIYIIFFVLLFHLIKNAYLKNIFKIIARRLADNSRKVLLSLALIIILVIFIDLPISSFFDYFNNPLMEQVARFGNSFGKGEVHFSILLVLILIFMILKKEKLKNIFSISLISAVFSGITVDILKVVFTRARPVITANTYKFFAFIDAYQEGRLFQYEYLSMPSGHTITVIAAVVPLYLYFRSKFIRALLILLAVIPAVSRIYSNVHWVSDVAAGGLLGIFLGRLIYDINKDKT